MGWIKYIDESLKEPEDKQIMVGLEIGLSTNDHPVFRDELRVMESRNPDVKLISIEIGLHDKWALLHYLVTELLSKPDGESIIRE